MRPILRRRCSSSFISIVGNKSARVTQRSLRKLLSGTAADGHAHIADIDIRIALYKLKILDLVVRPEKWDDSPVGFRGSNASGGRFVFLPGALGARCCHWTKMATLGASLLLCILQCFRA